MTEITKNALFKSIQQWVDIRWNEGSSIYGGCALCNIPDNCDNCDNCIIRLKTGKNECRGTVLYDWRAVSKYVIPYVRRMNPDDPKSVKLTKEMLNFLIDLYPGELTLEWEYQ